MPWVLQPTTGLLVQTRNAWRLVHSPCTHSHRTQDPCTRQFLDELYASGCTNWDTANIYGDSEVLIGQWSVPASLPSRYDNDRIFPMAMDRLKRSGKRNEIFLATKMGITGNADRPSNGEPAYVRECLDRSLSRLGGTHSRLAPAERLMASAHSRPRRPVLSPPVSSSASH